MPAGSQDDRQTRLRNWNRPATWAGNSPDVIHRDYKGLVKEADATEFWNLTPAAVRSEVVKLPMLKAA